MLAATDSRDNRQPPEPHPGDVRPRARPHPACATAGIDSAAPTKTQCEPS